MDHSLSGSEKENRNSGGKRCKTSGITLIKAALGKFEGKTSGAEDSANIAPLSESRLK